LFIIFLLFSAGVGRTGTLIAVDILLQHICENKKVDIFGTVFKLRKQRVNMVQTEVSVLYESLAFVNEKNMSCMK
jgi:Protein tyrosine phosphatase